MKIILKYKKTFILVAIISLIISLLPTLGMFYNGYVTGSKVVGTVESIIDVNEVTTEGSINLKIISLKERNLN